MGLLSVLGSAGGAVADAYHEIKDAVFTAEEAGVHTLRVEHVLVRVFLWGSSLHTAAKKISHEGSSNPSNDGVVFLRPLSALPAKSYHRAALPPIARRHPLR